MNVIIRVVHSKIFFISRWCSHEKALEIPARQLAVARDWCGDRACEDKIKELTNATARCIPFNQIGVGGVCPVCGKKATKVVLFAKAY